MKYVEVGKSGTCFFQAKNRFSWSKNVNKKLHWKSLLPGQDTQIKKIIFDCNFLITSQSTICSKSSRREIAYDVTHLAQNKVADHKL